MMGVCLGLAGAIWAQLPEGRFTLAWQHSVQKVRWEEDYQVTGRLLTLVEARVQGSGAGMEIPDHARFDRGQWRYSSGLLLPRLRLGRTPEAGDYDVCLPGGCRAMAHWVGPPAVDTPAIELWVCNLD